MPSAQVLHLLPQPPQATPPDPGTIISASVPSFGNVSTRLLDPAVSSPPLTGANQIVQYAANGWANDGANHKVVYGRFLTRMLPAQTISAGTWKLAVATRNTGTGTTYTEGVSGFCVAQWRPGSGVIARAVDTPGTGGQLAAGSAGADANAIISIGGGSALTLLANDCIIVEVWGNILPTNNNVGTATTGLLLGGLGQLPNGTVWAMNAMTDTDAVLIAPAAITFT
jgi:hypothetical protein